MLFKHPLFWKEWKSAKWWSLLIIGIFLIMFLAISNSLQTAQELIIETGDNFDIAYYELRHPIFSRSFYNVFEEFTIAILPIVIIITIIQFNGDRKENIGMFISSLPFTKKEQFIVKWFTGMLVITIPFLVLSILTLLIRLANWHWIYDWYKRYPVGDRLLAYDTMASIMLGVLQGYLFFIAFYTILMLMQTLIANNIAASIIGTIVMLVPWFIFEAGSSTVYNILNKNIRVYYSGWMNLYELKNISREYIQITTIDKYREVIISGNVVSYDNYPIKIIGLIVIILLALYAGIKFYGKNENSRNGYLTMFLWVEKILVFGVVLCSGLLGNNLLRKIIRKSSTIYELITLAFSAFIGYVIIRKIINMSQRHSV